MVYTGPSVGPTSLTVSIETTPVETLIRELANIKTVIKGTGDSVNRADTALFELKRLIMFLDQYLLTKEKELEAALKSSEGTLDERAAAVKALKAEINEIAHAHDRLVAKGDQIIKDVSNARSAIEFDQKLLDQLNEQIGKATGKIEITRGQATMLFTSMMHMADRLIDTSKSDFSRYFGTVVGIISNSLASLNSMAYGLAATGNPLAIAQAGMIVASNTISSAFLISAQTEAQGLASAKTDFGDVMFG